MHFYVKKNPREMAKSLCHLLNMKVNYVIVASFYVANISFNTIRENKILAKISESIVSMPMAAIFTHSHRKFKCLDCKMKKLIHISIFI